MKFLNLGCPQKLYYKICKILSYSRVLCNCKCNIIKLSTGSILFSNRTYKGRKKTSNERKKYRIHEYKFTRSAENWTIRKYTAIFKFLQKLAPTTRKLIFI